jgi:hypothetical protein
MGADWQLSTCCGTEETVFCCLFAGYFIINLALWKTALLKPMKLIAVFIHEMSHATACWWTGGQVEAIEVYTNEGGVTKYRGGVRAIIIPAGYVGGAFWGGVFVTLSGDRIAATVAGSIFIVSMLVSLRFSPNKVLVMLMLGFTSVTALFIFLDWFVYSPLLQYVILYYGVFIGSFSVCKLLPTPFTLGSFLNCPLYSPAHIFVSSSHQPSNLFLQTTFTMT